MNEYRGLEAKWHDLFWAEEEVSELPVLEKFLKEVDGEILYVGSGSGRLLGPLTQTGHAVTGLEASSEMVELSREWHPQARVREGRWEDFETEQTYAAILLPGFTFQLFSRPVAALAKMRELVEPGGRVYLSLFFPWLELSGEVPQGSWYEDRTLALPDGTEAELFTRHRVKERQGILVREHRYRHKSAAGKILREDLTKQTIHFFTDQSLNQLLSRSGWELEKELSQFGEELEPDEPVYVSSLFLKLSEGVR